MSAMTKAMTLQQHVVSQLAGAAANVEARRVPANAQGLWWLDIGFAMGMTALELRCGIWGDRLDPESEWPGLGPFADVDTAAVRLDDWRRDEWWHAA